MTTGGDWMAVTARPGFTCSEALTPLTLGITHLAVSHYERVLTSVRERMHETDDYEEREYIRSSSLAWESAHNLVLIYTSSGSLDLVRSRSEEWLALRD